MQKLKVNPKKIKSIVKDFWREKKICWVEGQS